MEESIIKERVSYICTKCGTIISSEKDEKKCPYCSEKLNASYKTKSNIKYNYIIPFTHSKKDIANIIKKYIKSRPLFPKNFNIKNNINNIKSIFIPLWIFDFEASGEIEVEGAKISKFKSNSKSYKKTDLYNITIGGNMNFANMTLHTSKKITENIIDNLDNYDYSKQIEFDNKYIKDRLVEELDMKIRDIISLSEVDVKELFKNKLIGEIKDYDEIESKENTINIRNTRKNCVLVPVWLLSINYKNQEYDIYVNGQTGKVIGNIPISYKKLVFKSIFTFLLIFLIIYFLLNYKVML